MPPGDRRRTRRLIRIPTATLLAAVLFVLVLFPLGMPVFRIHPAPSFPVGHSAGRAVFDTPLEAALDFGRRYNQLSIEAHKEYATVIYLVARVELRVGWRGRLPVVEPTLTSFGYAYTVPVVGSSDSAVPDLFGARGPVVGLIHSHGAYSAEQGPGNDDFSFGLFHDTYWADFFDLPFYLATPDGRLRVYLPNLAGPAVVTLADDLPYDPWHPSRIQYGGGSF
jgi:hypothetical protein